MISIFHCLMASWTTTSFITRISWETTLIPGAIAQKATDSRCANNASSLRWLHDLRLSNEFASRSFSLSLQHPQPARHYERFTSDGGIFFPRQYPLRSLIYDNYLVTFERSSLAGENRSFAVTPLRRFFYCVLFLLRMFIFNGILYDVSALCRFHKSHKVLSHAIWSWRDIR